MVDIGPTEWNRIIYSDEKKWNWDGPDVDLRTTSFSNNTTPAFTRHLRRKNSSRNTSSMLWNGPHSPLSWIPLKMYGESSPKQSMPMASSTIPRKAWNGPFCSSGKPCRKNIWELWFGRWRKGALMLSRRLEGVRSTSLKITSCWTLKKNFFWLLSYANICVHNFCTTTKLKKTKKSILCITTSIPLHDLIQMR